MTTYNKQIKMTLQIFTLSSGKYLHRKVLTHHLIFLPTRWRWRWDVMVAVTHSGNKTFTDMKISPSFTDLPLCSTDVKARKYARGFRPLNSP
jgi:hypothetical protein